MTDLDPLPVAGALPELADRLRRANLVALSAAPGSGKTSLVAPALVDADWLAGARIVLLEPRRVAARAAARRMASLHDDRVGGLVGIRTRHDTRVGERTIVEVVTDGVAARMIQSDPSLDGIGLLVFDEIHERHLDADLTLALALDVQRQLRPDLRILLMSATLDIDRLRRRIGLEHVVEVDVPTWPVETVHRPPTGREDLTATAARVVAEELTRCDAVGDILVFCAGMADIRALHRRLDDDGVTTRHDVVVRVLHGSRPASEQDAALRPDPDGRRRVVLSTSLAESSVTVEGVRTVVDTGRGRRPELDRSRGLEVLRTVSISRAAADQRRGRAGREGPGRAIRLWSRDDHGRRPAHDPPEITRADLAALTLELAAWGVGDPGDLTWIDPPPDPALGAARRLLRRLGALDPDGRITPHGRRLHALGTHPRVANLLIRGADAGLAPTAAVVAALLTEGDVVTGRGHDTDLRWRVERIAGTSTGSGALDRARREMRHWRRRLGLPRSPAPDEVDPERAGLLVSFAYPDRIGARRDRGDSVLLANGAAAALAPHDPAGSGDLVAVALVEGAGGDVRVALAAPLDRADLDAHHGDHLVTESSCAWDRRRRDVVAEERLRLGALVLRRRPLDDVDPGDAISALLEGLEREGLELLPWTDAARSLRERLAFLHHHLGGDWPPVDDASLSAALPTWLGPRLVGARRRRDLDAVDVHAALGDLIGRHRRHLVDELAPTHLPVPSGRRVRLDYGDPDRPVLAVRLQEMFGCSETPRVAGGRVAVVVHLLSPAGRPLQITTDLASFWREGYAAVRREQRGRYPRHRWPDDPLGAAPDRRRR